MSSLIFSENEKKKGKEIIWKMLSAAVMIGNFKVKIFVVALIYTVKSNLI